MYSQNNEDDFILNYFKGFKGNLLDIGANDGETLSNSRLLIENGWHASLVEPDNKAFEKLDKLYASHPLVSLYHFAIGERDEVLTLYSSGEHLKKGDTGLLSSFVKKETHRWKDETFTEQFAAVRTYNSLFLRKKFDFITIDAEAMDYQILSQIPLSDTRCVCIEWNGNHLVRKSIELYCEGYGLKTVKENAENLIIVR